MLVDELPEDVRRSFLAGYDLDELAVYALQRSREEAEAAASGVPVPEAFYDALRLQSAIFFVYSADTKSEYNQDIADYDDVARDLNRKYGDIVVLSSESLDLGLRGHRRPVFSTVTTGVRGADGTREVTVVDHAAEIEREDAVIRSQASETERADDQDEPSDRTEELASRLGLSPLEFAELFGGDWRDCGAAQWPDHAADFVPLFDDAEAWMVSGEPAQLMIRVEGHGVHLAQPEGWWSAGTHGLTYRPFNQSLLTFEALDSASKVIEDLLRSRRRTFRYCRICRRSTPPELRHEPDLCMSCATRWHGVVH